MTARLRANWFETAEDVRGMGPEDARAAGVPARLFASVRATLDEDEEDDVEARNGETKGTKREESESGWIGGALPGAGTRAPTVTREGGTALADVRVTQRRRLKPFSLRGEEVSAELEEELNTLVRDLTSRRVGGGRAPVRGPCPLVAFPFLSSPRLLAPSAARNRRPPSRRATAASKDQRTKTAGQKTPYTSVGK